MVLGPIIAPILVAYVFLTLNPVFVVLRLMADKDELSRKCSQLAELVRVSGAGRQLGPHHH